MKTKNLLFYFSILMATSFGFSEEGPTESEASVVLAEPSNEADSQITDKKPSQGIASLAAAPIEEKQDIPEIETIRPAVKLPMEPWKMITLGLIILLAIIALIIWLRKYYQHQKNLPIIPVDPYQEALKALDEAFQHIQQLDQRPFAFGITDAVRQYLASVFKLPAPGYTTDEVLEKLPSVQLLPENLQQDIIRLLQQCDLAKFTKQVFEQPQRLELYNLAKNILMSSDKIIQLQTEKEKTIQ